MKPNTMLIAVYTKTKRSSSAFLGVLLAIICASCISEDKQLGWHVPVPEVPVAAQEAHKKAVISIESKHADLAEKHFQSALKQAPHYDLARFNYARYLADAQKFEASIRELKSILVRDFPGYLPRIYEEPAFKKINELDDKLGVENLYRRWSDMLKDGVGMLHFIKTPTSLDGEPPEFYPKHKIRPGIYSILENRFYPIGPIMEDTVAVLIDPMTSKVVNIKADATVDLFSTLSSITWQIDPWLPEKNNISEKHSFDDPYVFFAEIDFTYTKGELKIITIEKQSQLQKQSKLTGSSILRLMGEGSLLLSSEDGYYVDGKHLILPAGKKVELLMGREAFNHHSILLYDNGVFVLSSLQSCSVDEPQNPIRPIQAHVLEYVDIKSMESTLISQGKTTASIQKTNDGQILFQTGSKVETLSKNNGKFERKLIDNTLVTHVPLELQSCVYH